MNHTLTPVIADCPHCPWEQACNNGIEAAGKLAQHLHLRHDQPLPPQEVTGSTWQAQAVDAIRQVAARGQTFRIFDALEEFGLQAPPDAKHAIGRLAQLVHDQGIAHPVGAAPSTRPATKASQAAVWHRNPAKCISHELRCRAKAGIR